MSKVTSKKSKRGGSRKSLNPKSRSYYEEQDYIVASVDKWIPTARKFKDLFGIIDLLAIGKNSESKEWEAVYIQVTAPSLFKRHFSEMVEEPEKLNAARMILNVPGNYIEYHGWKKVGARYQLERLRFATFEHLTDHLKILFG